MTFFSLSSGSNTTTDPKPTVLQVLGEQLLDSAIVGGIAAVSLGISGSKDYTAAAYAFGFAFLIKLKEYRKL